MAVVGVMENYVVVLGQSDSTADIIYSKIDQRIRLGIFCMYLLFFKNPMKSLRITDFDIFLHYTEHDLCRFFGAVLQIK